MGSVLSRYRYGLQRYQGYCMPSFEGARLQAQLLRLSEYLRLYARGIVLSEAKASFRHTLRHA